MASSPWPGGTELSVLAPPLVRCIFVRRRRHGGSGQVSAVALGPTCRYCRVSSQIGVLCARAALGCPTPSRPGLSAGVPPARRVIAVAVAVRARGPGSLPALSHQPLGGSVGTQG